MNEEELYEELEGIRTGAQKNEENLWGKIGDLSCELNNLQQELQRKDNNWNELKEELSDDNKFQLFYADENINTMMTLGAKYYRVYILDKIKELENGNK